MIWKPSSELPRIVRVYYGDPGVDVTKLLESATERALDDPDEVLSVEKVPFDEALALCARGEIRDAKSMCALLLADLRRRGIPTRAS